jgi:flavin reductase (DIM6/NTAB) family NADH-FMN oxidoreductase RutF
VLPELQLVDGHAAADEFTDAMSVLASGVVLVTCSVDGGTWGTTVTAFTPVSADPPTVLASLASASTAAVAIAATQRFGVLVLGAHQVGDARACSVPGASKFVAERTRTGALARLECEVVRAVVVHDHTVFFARVRSADAAGGRRAPLLYHRRRYLCPSS